MGGGVGAAGAVRGAEGSLADLAGAGAGVGSGGVLADLPREGVVELAVPVEVDAPGAEPWTRLICCTKLNLPLLKKAKFLRAFWIFNIDASRTSLPGFMPFLAAPKYPLPIALSTPDSGSLITPSD